MGTVSVLCLAVPALAGSDLSIGDGSGADNERLLPGLYPADPTLTVGEYPSESYDPLFDIDWTLALRGTYTKSTSGESFDTRIVPAVSLEHQGSRSIINFDASAEVVRPTDGKIDVSGLRLSAKGGYALDSVTNLTGNADLSLTRAMAGTPGVASTIAIAPQSFSGGVGLGVTRQFGKFNVGVTGAAVRSAYGETTLTDGSVANNSGQNLWSLDAGLRVGFQATPIFEVFGQAGIGRDLFDLPSATLGTKTDATTATLEAGVTGRWNDILEATASTGVALRRFDDSSLGEVTAQLYDAQVIFTPDPTWRLVGGFATKVEPPGPDAGGTTRIGYAATAEVGYTVNSWLALRALADWTQASFVGSAETQTGYGWGAGADYKVNAHTSVTADYGYAQSNSTVSGVQEAHQVTVGITLSR